MTPMRLAPSPINFFSMKFNRSLFASTVGLVGVMLLSGCIKMDVQQTVNTDGSSHMKVVYDMTGMVESMQSMDDGTNPDALSIITPEDAQASCDQFTTETSWANPTCSIEGYVFTMEGDVQLESPAFTSSKGLTSTSYNYDLKDLYTQLQAVGDSQGQEFSDTALKEQKEYVEFTGIELTYTLTMPGTITTSDVGTISEDGTNVTINLFDMAELESAHVVSEVKSAPWLWIGGGVGGLIVVLGLVGFMMKKKKGPAAPTAAKA